MHTRNQHLGRFSVPIKESRFLAEPHVGTFSVTVGEKSADVYLDVDQKKLQLLVGKAMRNKSGKAKSGPFCVSVDKKSIRETRNA